jgi:hypothetical protein
VLPILTVVVGLRVIAPLRFCHGVDGIRGAGIGGSNLDARVEPGSCNRLQAEA